MTRNMIRQRFERRTTRIFPQIVYFNETLKNFEFFLVTPRF